MMIEEAPLLGLSLPLQGKQKHEALLEVAALLSSVHFRNGQRNQMFLRYVVEQAIQGNTASLKERNLGIEVFGRSADYDTGNDPVVRATAAEVRKKIALCYQERQPASISIRIPTGGYVPIFIPHIAGEAPIAAGQHKMPAVPQITGGAETIPKIKVWPRLFNWRAMVIVGIVFVLGLAAIYSTSRRVSALDQFWHPVLSSSAPIVVVLGHSLAGSDSRTDEPLSTAVMRRVVPLQDAVASSEICGSLRVAKRTCDIVSTDDVNLSALHNHSVLLIGLFDNPWSARLLDGLRYTLQATASDSAKPVAAIVDRKSGGKVSWAVDFETPNRALTVDYALVSRFFSKSTNGQVMIASGITGAGTEAASNFVNDEGEMEQLARLGPKSGLSQNVEAVLRIEIYNGHPGKAQVVAADFW